MNAAGILLSAIGNPLDAHHFAVIGAAEFASSRQVNTATEPRAVRRPARVAQGRRVASSAGSRDGGGRQRSRMSFRSPLPDVAIPNQTLFDYLFTGIADVADRPAVIDGPSGAQTTFGQLVRQISA